MSKLITLQQYYNLPEEEKNSPGNMFEPDEWEETAQEAMEIMGITAEDVLTDNRDTLYFNTQAMDTTQNIWEVFARLATCLKADEYEVKTINGFIYFKAWWD